MIQRQVFGTLLKPDDIFIFTLSAGVYCAKVTNYGGALISFFCPDKDGNTRDVVLGFDSPDGYVNNTAFIGSLIGRYANRIGNGSLIIGDKRYQLAVNDGPNHLHGGLRGFDKRLWDARIMGDILELSLFCPDGEEGYPGNLSVKVTYELKEDGSLILNYRARSDADTVINLTNHAYFNLNGVESESTVLDHRLMIQADHFCENDSNCLPTGTLLPVNNTPFDFRSAKEIGKDIELDNAQLRAGSGYDHFYVLGHNDGLAPAASVYSPLSGILLECRTTAPGLQFYSGNHLIGQPAGKSGVPYSPRSGFCLEMQNFPDAPNHSSFPSAFLRFGEAYLQTSVYQLRTLCL